MNAQSPSLSDDLQAMEPQNTNYNFALMETLWCQFISEQKYFLNTALGTSEI